MPILPIFKAKRRADSAGMTQPPVAVAMIAAFPPPISGQSLAAKLLYDGLKADGDFETIAFDISQPIDGAPIAERVLKLCRVAFSLARCCAARRRLVVYLQLGHGVKALCRDLVFMTIAAATRHPCVAHVHGSGLRKALESMPVAVKQIEKLAIGRLNAAIVLSDHLREMFFGILDENRIIAIDNGIDPNFIRLAEADPDKPASDEIRILFLSNFIAQKGLFTLLEAAKIAQKAHKNYRFELVGAPEKTAQTPENDAERFVRENRLRNTVISPIATGVKKHEAYKNADIFALPSQYEGQPLCIIEALFEGLPVITTRAGGIPDIFGDSPCARYVEPGDAQAIVDAIDSLSDASERMRLAALAKSIAYARFTPEKHINAVKDILRKAFFDNSNR